MELIDKIQRQLDENHYVEKEDIQTLVNMLGESNIEVRQYDEEIDEVVSYKSAVHLERMANNHIWLSIESADDYLSLHLVSKSEIGITVH